MSLKEWHRNGWLTKHRSSNEEIDGLLGVVERDLHDAATSGLSADWKFGIAYNAILQCALVALVASGYRPARQAHHYRGIQSLRLTLGESPERVQLFDTFRKKRNIVDYECSGTVSDAEAQEILQIAISVRDRLVDWLKDKSI